MKKKKHKYTATHAEVKIKPKVCIFTIADNKNLKFYEGFKNSLRKFHSEKEVDLILIGEEQIKAYNDPHFFYRSKPTVAKELLKKYDTVVGADCDQIIMGDLSHLWDTEEEWDLGVVQNANPREKEKYPVRVWNIDELSYVNAGFVVMKDKKFVDHWDYLCKSPHFGAYQMREQDLLNILVFYGMYKVKFLDNSTKWHGLVSKGYEPIMKLIDKSKLVQTTKKTDMTKDELDLLPDKSVVLPKNEEWPVNEDKQVVCYHFAGGKGDGSKGNYRIRFPDKISKHIDWLISDNENTKKNKL